MKIMKAMEAESAALLASHPGPNMESARTPMAAQPIWAMNKLYFCSTTKMRVGLAKFMFEAINLGVTCTIYATTQMSEPPFSKLSSSYHCSDCIHLLKVYSNGNVR